MDQRTFERTASAPSAADLDKSARPPLPALTISFAVADADWRPSVAAAVLAAQAHKPDAAFDVVTPVPVNSARDVQDRFIRQGEDDSALVARELQANGVPPERITIGLRGDPGNPPRQVELFVH